jgi:hypothetical protein
MQLAATRALRRALATAAAPVVVLYESPRPRLVLAAARLLAAKSAVALGGAAWALNAAGAGAGALPAAAAAATAPLATPAPAILAALAAAHVSPAGALAGGFFLLAALAGGAARALARGTLLRLEARADAAVAGGATLTARTPSLLGFRDAEVSFPRGAVLGAAPRATVQSFRVAAAAAGAPGGARAARTFMLFPVEPGWRSEDIGELRALVYGAFFRAAEEPGGAARRVAISDAELARGIAGFGPFRPAAFADPLAPAARALAARGDSGGGGGGGGALPPHVFAAHGAVWADFLIPAAPTEAEMRRAEAARAGGGARAALPLPALPPLPAGDDEGVAPALPAPAAAAAGRGGGA